MNGLGAYEWRSDSHPADRVNALEKENQSLRDDIATLEQENRQMRARMQRLELELEQHEYFNKSK